MSEFEENDIRPSDLIEKQSNILKKDIQRMLNNAKDFIHVGCPACAKKDISSTMEKYSFNFNICSHCETMYISPRPSSSMLEEYYKESENCRYWSKEIFPKSNNSRRNKIVIPRLERLLKFFSDKSENSKFVEVGAGFGTFSSEVLNRGIFDDVIVIEPNPFFSENCRKKNLTVLQSSFENVDIDSESVDVLVAFEVIEHLFSPYKFIKKCYDMLKMGGILSLTFPNIKGFDITTLGKFSKSIDNSHLNYFNPYSIKLLLERCKFDIIDLKTPGVLDAEIVRKESINGNIDLTEQPFLKSILIERWDELGGKFQTFLIDNLLSSHLWVVAKKE